MPDRVRDWRRAEIESDLWEQAHDRPPSAGQLLGRLLRGIPADIMWRIEEEAMHSKTVVVLAASAGIVLGAGAMWLRDTMRVDWLPTPPRTQVEVGLPGRALPPPPPP